jgi:muconolactone delta-isomerase
MDNHQVQFMVDFTMPHDLPEDFVSRIPQQRALVNRLLSEGKILNYALSLENSKLWVVFSAQSESDLIDLIEQMPLTRFMKYRISELTFFNASNPFVQAFSMN